MTTEVLNYFLAVCGSVIIFLLKLILDAITKAYDKIISKLENLDKRISQLETDVAILKNNIE